jgi:DNA-directed RNA polymerase specialized sigma24 family protein
MGIEMEDLPDQMSLSALEDCCISQIEHYRRNEPHNDRYCLEIFYRAMVKHDADAWKLLQQRFTPTVLAWMRNNPYREVACRHEPEENYVDDAFARVWQASMRNRLEFTTLGAALNYLKTSLQGAVIDKLRAYSRPREVPLPDPGSDTYAVAEPASEDEYGSYELWEIIKSLLPNKRERRLAYLMYVGGLKPREIVHFCVNEFSDIQEVYRLTRNIIERLMRHRDHIRWRMSDGQP